MKVLGLVVVSILALNFVAGNPLGRTQSTAVIGRVFCNGNWTETPADVVLWDRDLTDKDDKMGETKTKDHGSFYVQGHEKEFTAIDPEIRIHHTCPEVPSCVKVEVPADYITAGLLPTKIFDAGTIELTKPGVSVC
ncbi:hypothetical protein M3Y94_01074300 [Aphelenchoides besseyi]|nr:hypothetical protein M3Y94_01074300 [Aphelenchoides besseyi]KAI6218731.1 hypothetical protein M3Y95_01147200 [Aphelenchoides besseyi]